MKSLTHYIQEKLVINSLQEKLVINSLQEKLVIKKKKTRDYKYFPKTKEELRDIIERRIKKEGNKVDLNDIDTSKITDMSELFRNLDFNGDISNWDVSKVLNMNGMFLKCRNFNQDISNWDVSNVKDMSYMFHRCEYFNQDISNWDVSNVTNMDNMFWMSKSFNQDISNWDVSNVKGKYSSYAFDSCPIDPKYKPKFK